MVASKNNKDNLGAHLGQVFYCDFQGQVELSLFISNGKNWRGKY